MAMSLGNTKVRFWAATLAPTFFAILALLLNPASAKADEGEKALLHVTSVRQEEAKDWCETGGCYATRFTVEGYRAARKPDEVVRYVLECIEVIQTEKGKTSLSCVRVQADGEYDAKIFADSIVFQPLPPPDGTLHGAYNIKSQRVEKRDK
jgi:hypothetical protein